MKHLWNHIRCIYILMCIGIFLTPLTAEAGPWSKSLGGAYAKINAGSFTSDTFTNSAGELQRGSRYFGATASVYFEIGVLKGLHVQGSIPYLIATNFGTDGSRFTQGTMGDGMLGLQYQLPIPGPLVVAVVANAKLPMYDLGRLANKKETSSHASSFPAQGDGQLDLTFWLSVGGSLRSLPMFMFLDVGYRHRTEVFFGTADSRTFGDSFQFFGQIGYTVWRKQGVIISLNAQGTLPFAEDKYTKGLFSVGLGVFFPILNTPAGKWAIELAVDPLLWARNAGQGWGWSIGLSFSR